MEYLFDLRKFSDLQILQVIKKNIFYQEIFLKIMTRVKIR